MRSLVAIALCTGVCGLRAQAVADQRLVVTAAVTSGGYGPVGTMMAAVGMSARVWAAGAITASVGGSYAGGLITGYPVCVSSSCDTRRVRDERRVTADLSGALPSSALFLHLGAGVSWSRVIGGIVQDWRQANDGRTFAPLGLGQVGIGLRSMRALHPRWIEAGWERQAASSHPVLYLRAGLGVK